MSIHEQVRQYLGQVRRRLRLHAAARGLGLCGVIALAATIAAVLGADAWRFSDRAVGIASVLLWLAVLGAIGWFLIRPLLRKISDLRLAHFVEEQHPEFRDRLVTAVELGSKAADPTARLFGELVAEDALQRAPQAAPHRIIAHRRIWRPLIWAGGSVAAILLLGWLGPGVFRYGTRVLWVGWAQAKVNPLYQIQVTPGDIVIGRSTDQEIVAQPQGFSPTEMRLHVLYAKSADWQAAPMLSGGGSFHFLLLNLQDPVQYYVESNGVRSLQYKIDVIAVPRAERLELHYHYPAYSGMADTVEQSGGDIMALKGTEVTLIVHTDAPSPGGRLILDKGDAIALQKLDDRRLQATWTLSQDALYHVQLQDHLGREARASEEYLMQAVQDMPPTVHVTRPGRDLQPTSIDEVVIGLQAQDDVRLEDLTLHYSVNGGKDNAVPLVSNNNSKTASGTHLIPLEEFNLVPGDVISYYGAAKDGASNSVSTDMYFLQVRPFERSYTQAQSAGSQGGSGADTFLSEKEKQVIAATWNVVREKGQQRPDQLSDAAQVLSKIQRSLAEQAKTMSTRLQNRELTGVNDEFAGLADNLNKAVEAMGPAADALQGQKFQPALTPEQTALEYLLRAEAMYKDIQVAFGSQGGGGGGSNAARDLTDLFSLELDKSKNQYETLSQFSGSQDQESQMQDLMRKLQDLARRQEELAKQQRQNPQDMRAADRWEQETLRRETEQLARQMDQLSQQMNSPQLGQASRSLSQAARDMEQAGQQTGQQGGQQGNQQGNQPGGQQSGQPGSQGGQSSGGLQSSEQARALQRLHEANQALSGQQGQMDEQKIQELKEKADELARRQQGIVDQTNRLAEQGGPSQESPQQFGPFGRRGQYQPEMTPEQAQATGELMENKSALLDGLRDLNEQMNQSAARLSGSQPKAAQDLRGASSWIQAQQMEDKIQQSGWMSQQGLWPTAAPLEQDLHSDLQQLQDRLQDAQRALAPGGGADDKLQQALQTAERVRQGLEAMQPSSGQPGQAGQQGQQGQSGQQGQQAQQGQQGQGQESGSQQAGNGGQRGGSEGNAGNPTGSSGQPQSGSQSARGGGANGNTNGGYFSGGSYNAGGPWNPSAPLTPEQLAQLQQQAEQLRQQASQLRGLIEPNSDFAKLAQQLVRSMNDFDPSRYQGNSGQFEQARSQLTEQWEELELRLRRELDMQQSDSLHLATQERVPEQYRALVEEYYRSLSRTQH